MNSSKLIHHSQQIAITRTL